MKDLPEKDAAVYLGDGLYASFDGNQIVLKTVRDNNVHFVALEPVVWQALHEWIVRYPMLKQHMDG